MRRRGTRKNSQGSNREQVVEGDNDSEQVVEGVSALLISPMTLRRRRTRVMVQQQLGSSDEEGEDESDVEWFVPGEDVDESDE